MELDHLLPANRNQEQQQQQQRDPPAPISAPSASWLDEVACLDSSVEKKKLCTLFPVSEFASGKFLLPPEPAQKLAPKHHEAEPLLSESCDEAACREFRSGEETTGDRSGSGVFCRMYQTESNYINFTPQLTPEESSSPETAFRMNNSFNAEYATSSVFRILRTRDSSSGAYEYGTGFAISPLIDSNEEFFMFFAVGAGHSFNDVEEGEFFKGCFGFVNHPGEFKKRGFTIDKYLLLHACSEIGDVAVFKCSIRRNHPAVQKLRFLLPCSAGRPGSYCAAFGYPSIEKLLPGVERDLENLNTSHLWQLYGEEFESSDQLVASFRRLLRSCTPGMLFCSPATVETSIPDTHFATLRCTTFHGSSGGPVMPNDVEGFVAMVFKGRKEDTSGTGLVNMGTSLDFPPFVDYYKHHIFPHIPRGLHLQRDTRKFKEWCSLHKIKKISLISSLVYAVGRGARKMLTRLQTGLGLGSFRQQRVLDSSQ